MAQLATTFSTYDAKGIREELSDLIANISPTDVPFQSNIGSEPTGNTFFEWQTDSLAAASTSNHQIEGDDLGNTYTAITATTRIGNYASILRKDGLVSRTQRTANTAGRQDEFAYQVMKKSKEIKRDWEAILLDNNAAVAGNDTTARETAGLPAFLKTNTNYYTTDGLDPNWATQPTGARSDGTTRAFSEAILKDVIKQVYDSGGEPSILMVGSFNKQAASAFTGISANRWQTGGGAEAAAIVGAVEVYVSDFGEIRIVPNRFQRARDAFVIDPDGIRTRVLDQYQLHEMAKTGDGDKFMITMEAGLQVDNEAGQGIAADLTTS